MRILFLLKKRNGQHNGGYAASYGLINSVKFIYLYLTSLNIESKFIEVVDANAIDREVYLYKPTHVIIEALWTVPDKFRELARLHPNVHWIVRIHSVASFLATEGIAFQWVRDLKHLYDNGINIQIGINNKIFYESINDMYGNFVVYLPNIYHIDKYRYSKKEKLKNRPLEIGCFGALRQLKNHMYQAISAVRFAELEHTTVRFHINVSPLEQDNNAILKNLRNFFDSVKDRGHQLIEWKWMSHEEFLDVISTMDLGMQLSYTESFNIVSADFIAMGVPILVSNCIDWVPFYMMTENTHNYDKTILQMKLLSFLRNNKLSQWYMHYKLNKYNKHAQFHWLSYLNK